MENQNSDTLKKQWRTKLKKVRQELPPDRRQAATEAAYEHLRERCEPARFILSFASFQTEIDLWPLNWDFASENRLVLPYTHEKEIHLYHVTNLKYLKIHPWGLLEPDISQCDPIDISKIDIALIPGLGFDLETKYRLGYGRGYYDRLLSTHYFKQSWGIGFLEQAVRSLPYDSYDIPLSEIHLF